MSLKMGAPSLDNETPKITPQQERSLALENNTANLEGLNSKVDDAIKNNHALNQFPETAKELIQNALVRECYLKCGENPNITDIKINHNLKTDETTIALKTFNSEVSIDADKALNENKWNNDPVFNLDSLKSNIRLQGLANEVEKENAKFEGNKEVLGAAFDKAVEYRSNFVEEREAEINNAGKINRMLGKAPERIPSISEVPITKDEILRHVPLGLKNNEDFLKLLDSSMEQNHHFSDRNMGRNFLNELKNNEIIPPNVLKDYLQHEPNADVESLKSKLSEHIQQINEINTFNKEKDALSEAFKGANNERLMAVIERNKEIENASNFKKFFGFGPERIPTVGEQGLSKEEILKHVDPKIAESETFQVMLNGMVERLEKSATGEVSVDFWDEVKMTKESFADTAKTTLAVGEAVVVESVNSIAEGLQGAGSLGVGIGVAVANLDIDKGISASIGTFENLREQNQDIKLSEFSKKQLENSETMQSVAEFMTDKKEASVKSATEMWGEDVGKLVNDGFTASEKVLAIAGAKYPLNSTVKLGANIVDSAGASLVKAIKPYDPNAVIRVTQFYDPTKGSFPIDGKYAIYSKPTTGIAKFVDGARNEITWVAPFPASEMNFFKRVFTGVGDRKNYVEFSVKASELNSPGGVKNTMSYFQKTIDGKIDLTDSFRNFEMGTLKANKFSNTSVFIGNTVVIGGVLYKWNQTLFED